MKLPFYLSSLLCSIFLLLASSIYGQVKISGTITDAKGLPIQGASISLENTLDGTSSDSLGRFSFATSEKGNQVLSITAVGYIDYSEIINLDSTPSFTYNIKLNQQANTLDNVTITAGTFASTQGNQKTMLNPLEIVTTAGSLADPVAALQTIPGVQRSGSETGMMVRGGDAAEASVVVDGLTVQNPFFSNVPGVASRSRFNIFQFKGLSFSSGGYSARYGQAMSSILELNTLDLPEESTINLGVNFAGLFASASKLFANNTMGLTASANYTNLSPFYKLANTNFDFYDVPKGGSFSLGYDWKNKHNGLLKIMTDYSSNKMGIRIPNPFVVDTTMRYGIDNQHFDAMVTYKQMLNDKLNWFVGSSYSYNDDNADWGSFASNNKDQRAQIRNEFTWYIAPTFNLVMGGEWQHFTLSQTFDTFQSDITENQTALYVEGSWTPKHWLAIRPGLRYENSALLHTNTLAPRIAASVKTNQNSQFSLAGGLFYQSPKAMYLQQGYRPEQQYAVHYIANYQWTKDDRTLRIEAYYKNYKQLVLEHDTMPYDPNDYRRIYGYVNNAGHGYANGVDFFWRDKKTIKNLDYWISYSYVNTKRLYENFPKEATPSYIANHNLSIVSKYWLDDWHTMFSVTYSYASGKPYYNPNNPVFLGNKTPSFNNLSLQASYVRSFNKWFAVFYIMIDNVLNQKNIYGYRYSSDGSQRYAVEPALYRSIFFGINLSLSKFDKDEL